jgi:hypothetical protein
MSWKGMQARLILPLVALLAALMAAAVPAAAQDDPAGTGFINPFPPNDTYNIVMIGDDLAEGLLAGSRTETRSHAPIIRMAISAGSDLRRSSSSTSFWS